MGEESDTEWTYTRKTAGELDQLARDIVDGKVFGTWIPGSTTCFLGLVNANMDLLKLMMEQDVIHAYEYMNKAGERTQGGLPTFTTHHLLDKTDSIKLNELVKNKQATKIAREEKAEDD